MQVKLCGDQLIHMLGIVCRSSRQQAFGANFYNYLKEEHAARTRRRRQAEEQEEPELEPKHSDQHTRRKRQTGLSTTCCLSSCTLHQLRLAC